MHRRFVFEILIPRYLHFGICIHSPSGSNLGIFIDVRKRNRRRIVLPPVAEPCAEERRLRAQLAIELSRPRFGCTDFFAGESVDALATDTAQRVHVLQRNARRALALVCQGIRRAFSLHTCPLRRPPAGFRHGRVQHLRHILCPAFQFRERGKLFGPGDPARRGTDGVQKLGDEVPNLFQHAPGRIVEKLLRRTGIGKNRAQHIAHHFFRRLLLRKLLSGSRIALLRCLHARVKVDARAIRPRAHGIFQCCVHVRALALQIMRHLVRGEIGIGPFLRIQRNFYGALACVTSIAAIALRVADAILRGKHHVVLAPQRLQHAQVRHLLPVQIFTCAVLPYQAAARVRPVGKAFARCAIAGARRDLRRLAGLRGRLRRNIGLYCRRHRSVGRLGLRDIRLHGLRGGFRVAFLVHRFPRRLLALRIRPARIVRLHARFFRHVRAAKLKAAQFLFWHATPTGFIGQIHCAPPGIRLLRGLRRLVCLCV